MLTPEMQTLIVNHPAGMVATIDLAGAPAVSPKATFVVLDPEAIAFGNIRSPGTVANLLARPMVEVCFIDVLTRRAVRAAGSAEIIAKAEADQTLLAAFEASWGPYLPMMSDFVRIKVDRAELVLSPAYDIGLTEAELRKTNLEKLQAL